MAAVADRSKPAELLAEMLREDRDRGYAFQDVWEEDLTCATAHSAGWREALEGTRDAWRDSWHDAPGRRSHLTLELADSPRGQVPGAGVVLG
jgi:hypothetical protein